MTRPDRILVVGGTVIELWPGYTRTTLPGGGEIHAAPQDNDAYRARAHALGYGDDTARMSRDHELSHTILAALLDLAVSPALQSVVRGTGPSVITGRDEDAALALQAFAVAARADLLAVAERLGRLLPAARLP